MVLRGEVVAKDGKVIAEAGTGSFITGETTKHIR
jgi:hypothetical protein